MSTSLPATHPCALLNASDPQRTRIKTLAIGSSKPYNELPGPLYRPPQPIGLFQNFIDHQQPVVVAVHRNHYRYLTDGDKYTIMDAITGSTVITLTFKWTTSLPREIRDAYQRPIFRLKMKSLSSTQTFNALTPDGGDHIMFSVRNNSGFLSTRIALSFLNPVDGRHTEITLEDSSGKGSAMNYKGVFILSSEPSRPVLGFVTPKPPTLIQEGPASTAMREKKRNKSYYVSIAPGVDGLLLTTMCLIVDEIKAITEASEAGAEAAAAASG